MRARTLRGSFIIIISALAVAGCGGSSGGGGGLAASSVPPAATPAATSSSGATAPGVTPARAVSTTSAPPAGVASKDPSDDPFDWNVDTTVLYDPVISAPTWVVPSPALPAQAPPMTSNNNVALRFHDGRLFMAWRTAEVHFASPNAKMFVVSSPDRGRTWDFEHKVEIGADVREPAFVSLGGRLFLYYFEAGTNPLAFEPKHVWCVERRAAGSWGVPFVVGVPGEIPWDVKVRRGRAWMTSYVGNHYGGGASAIDVFFKTSTDGIAWTPVDPRNPIVYRGGVSEVGFEFDEAGGLWAVGRNEDGDATGFGSHVYWADPGALGRWTATAKSDPERQDSPRMFRHGKDLYLVGRRDVNGPFDLGLHGLPFDQQKIANLAAYSLRPKRTALYAIDRAARKAVPIVDLPGNGDTAFPAIVRTGLHELLVANYTSPLGNPDRLWIHGQVSPQGTQIYFLTISFKKR